MSPVVTAVARRVVPIALVLAAALLVKGYTGTGDGFVAGAVVAVALGLQLAAGGPEEARRQPLVRRAGPIAMGGLLVALLVAFAPVASGSPLLTHVPAAGEEVTKVGSVELTTALAFDVGVFLLVVGAIAGILGRLMAPEEDRA
jgi:multisubunit Na+/H+ antiporter MnhB subunit